MKGIYCIDCVVKCDYDIDVVIAILGMDVNITDIGVRELLYQDVRLDHEAIDRMIPYIDKIHTIGYNLNVIHRINSKLLTI